MLYASPRLYVNFFQPSFKLKSKMLDGAKVHTISHDLLHPGRPYDRLLAHGAIEPAIKTQLKAQSESRDPVRLLQDIRQAQQTPSEIAAHCAPSGAAPATALDIDAFIKSLSTAWKDDEARATHRRPPGAKHWRRRKVDPFADAWPLVNGWLIAELGAPAKVLTERLAAMFSEAYTGGAQLRTLQRRVKAWRAERARELIMGRLREPAKTPTEASMFCGGTNVRALRVRRTMDIEDFGLVQNRVSLLVMAVIDFQALGVLSVQ